MNLEDRPGRRIRREAVPSGDPTAGGGGGAAPQLSAEMMGYITTAATLAAQQSGGTVAGLGTRARDFRQTHLQGGQADLTSIGDYKVTTGYGSTGRRGWGSGRYPVRKTINDLLDEARKWKAEEVTKMQARLWRAGYYDKRVYSGDLPVTEGKLDEATSMAYSALLRDSVVREKALSDLLTEGEADFDPEAAGYDGRAGNIGGGRTYVNRVSDPAALRLMAEQVAIAVTGRDALTDEEKARMADAIQKLEISEQSKGNAVEEAQQRTKFALENQSADAQVAAGRTGQNGRLADEQLVDVGSGHRLNPDAAAAFQEMRAAAAADGIKLAITDSYRSYDEQVAVRKKKGHLVATAEPGTSKHGLGTAIDANVNNPKTKAWLDANAGRFGFVNPAWAKQGGKSYEPWHWEFQGAHDDHGPTVAVPGQGPIQSSPDVYLPARTVTEVNVNPEARMTEQIRQTHAAEAGAHDIAGAYNKFRSIMGFGRLPTETSEVA